MGFNSGFKGLIHIYIYMYIYLFIYLFIHMCVCVHLLLQIIIPEYYILQADCASRVVSTPDVYERRY